MDGEAVAMDALFSNGKLLPPAHPQCRCAVEYEEIPMPTQAASGGTGLGNSLEGYTDRQGASADGAGRENLQESQRRKIGEQGQEIIDKPTYNKLTRDFLRRGGTIIRGEEAKMHLEKTGAYASYLAGSDIAFIRDDATVSDVLEEMYHAEQDTKQMFGTISNNRIFYLREIDAQKYLISVAEKYKIPLVEQDATRKALRYYETKLKEIDGVDLNDEV